MAGDVLRTPNTLAKYKKRRQELGDEISRVNLLELPRLREWRNWVMVQNQFPYDLIASSHAILVPKRWFIDEFEMNDLERSELTVIKLDFTDTRQFDCIIENIKHNRTVPNQFHLHCIKFKHVTPIAELS